MNGQVTLLEALEAPVLERMIALFQQGQMPHYEQFPDHFGPGDDRAAIAGFLRGFFLSLIHI